MSEVNKVVDGHQVIRLSEVDSLKMQVITLLQGRNKDALEINRLEKQVKDLELELKLSGSNGDINKFKPKILQGLGEDFKGKLAVHPSRLGINGFEHIDESHDHLFFIKKAPAVTKPMPEAEAELEEHEE